MAKGGKPKPHQKLSIIKETLAKRKTMKDIGEESNMVFSFMHFDSSQCPPGNSYLEADQREYLHEVLEVIQSYSQSTMMAMKDGDKFTIYGDFPPTSDFKHPTHVPPDAKWARIHINGLKVLAGHIYQNIFFVVFLDPDHRFWPMDN